MLADLPFFVVRSAPDGTALQARHQPRATLLCCCSFGTRSHRFIVVVRSASDRSASLLLFVRRPIAPLHCCCSFGVRSLRFIVAVRSASDRTAL